jgi:hypothetical protein
VRKKGVGVWNVLGSLIYVHLNDVFDLHRLPAILSRASDVIILDTPHSDFVEISSSSYDLSIFSSKTGSNHDEGKGVIKHEFRG